MLLKKGNFYKITGVSNSNLEGFDGNEYKVFKEVNEIILYHNGEDIEIDKECILCTELEKEFWLDSMNIIDEIKLDEDFDAVSMCEFEDWKIEKGYK